MYIQHSLLYFGPNYCVSNAKLHFKFMELATLSCLGQFPDGGKDIRRITALKV